MKSLLTRTVAFCLLPTAIGLFLGQNVMAGTAYKSAASGVWSDATTWTPNSPAGGPTTSDTVEIQGGHTVQITNLLATCGGLTINLGGVLQHYAIASGSSAYLTNAGYLTNYGTINRGGNSSPTHRIYFTGTSGTSYWVGNGDLTGTKCGLYINSGVTLDITGVSAGSPVKLASGGSCSFNLSGTLIAGGQVIANAAASAGALNVNAGSTLQCGNVNGITNGTIGTFNWVTTGAFNMNAAANYVFNGSSAQVTLGLPATVKSLTINNSAGVTLSQATTATNLTLTAGKLTTAAAKLLTIAAGGTGITGGSASAYVSGPLAQVYSAVGSKNYPVGLNGNYRAATVNITTLGTSPSTITVTPKEPASFGGTAPAGNTVWSTRSWTVASSTSTGNVCDLTVDGTDFTPAGAATLLDFDGSASVALTTSYVSPSYSAAGITLTASSDFALGCTIPAVPVISSVSAPICSPVEVDWGSVSGASSYNVYRKLSGGSYGAALAIGQTGTSYFDPQLSLGFDHFVR